MSEKLCFCYNCMNKIDGGEICGICGFSNADYELLPFRLKPGTVIQNRFVIGNVIGQGGFGITYIGYDKVLEMRVAVKEYYPSAHATRNIEVSNKITSMDASFDDFVNQGKKAFLSEARALAGFNDLEGVVDVRDILEENNTAYIIMEYLDGEDLKAVLKKRSFSVDEVLKLFEPVMNSLEKIHAKNVIHRDISPDNLIILKNGKIKLMDFGAARVVDPTDIKSTSVVLKAGFAPEEQYRRRGKMGPWTDIYALCATMYKCITGITPDEALERLYEDELKWPSQLGIDIAPEFENALKKGMAILAKDRISSVGELRSIIYGGKDSNESEEAFEKKSQPGADSNQKIESSELKQDSDAGLLEGQKNKHFVSNFFRKKRNIIVSVFVLLLVLGSVNRVGKVDTQSEGVDGDFSVSVNVVSENKISINSVNSVEEVSQPDDFDGYRLGYDENLYTHFTLKPTEVLSVKKFSSAIDDINAKLSMVFNDDYNYEVLGDRIEVNLPNDIYDLYENIADDCFEASGFIDIAPYRGDSDNKDYMDYERMIGITHHDIVSASVEKGMIPKAEVDETEDYHYIKIKLSSEWAELNKEGLSSFDFPVGVRQWTSDNGYFGRFARLYRLEDNDTFAIYIDNSKDNEETVREKACEFWAYDFTHIGTNVHFAVEKSISGIEWEKDETSFGINQIKPEDFEEETITAKYVASDKMGEGTKSDCILAFKTRLDTLGCKYAFGSKQEQEKTIWSDDYKTVFLVRMGYEMADDTFLDMLGDTRVSYDVYDSNGIRYSCYDKNLSIDDSNNKIVVTYDPSKIELNDESPKSIGDMVKHAIDTDEKYLYLGSSVYGSETPILFKADVPEKETAGKLEFDYIKCYEEPIDGKNIPYIKYIKEIYSGVVLPKKFSCDTIQKDYIRGGNKRYATFACNKNKELISKNISEQLQLLDPNAEIKGGSLGGMDVYLSLKVSDVEGACACIKKILDTWDFGLYSGSHVYIYPIAGNNDIYVSIYHERFYHYKEFEQAIGKFKAFDINFYDYSGKKDGDGKIQSYVKELKKQLLYN